MRRGGSSFRRGGGGGRRSYGARSSRGKRASWTPNRKTQSRAQRLVLAGAGSTKITIPSVIQMDQPYPAVDAPLTVAHMRTYFLFPGMLQTKQNEITQGACLPTVLAKLTAANLADTGADQYNRYSWGIGMNAKLKIVNGSSNPCVIKCCTATARRDIPINEFASYNDFTAGFFEQKDQNAANVDVTTGTAAVSASTPGGVLVSAPFGTTAYMSSWTRHYNLKTNKGRLVLPGQSFSCSVTEPFKIQSADHFDPGIIQMRKGGQVCFLQIDPYPAQQFNDNDNINTGLVNLFGTIISKWSIKTQYTRPNDTNGGLLASTYVPAFSHDALVVTQSNVYGENNNLAQTMGYQ